LQSERFDEPGRDTHAEYDAVGDTAFPVDLDRERAAGHPAVEDRGVRNGRSLDLRLFLQAPEHLPHYLFGTIVGIASRRRIEAEHHQVGRVEAGAFHIEPRKRLHEQSGADHENQREGNLPGHKRFPRAGALHANRTRPLRHCRAQ
jgi:hypothetical protein